MTTENAKVEAQLSPEELAKVPERSKKKGWFHKCDCGCGQYTNPVCKYIKGHQNKGEADRRAFSLKMKGKPKPRKKKEVTENAPEAQTPAPAQAPEAQA